MASKRTTSFLLAVLLPLAAVQPLRAQSGSSIVLPAIRHFPSPHADPIEPRSGAGLVLTDVLRARGPERPHFVIPDSAAAAREVQGSVQIGATLPLLRLASWSDGGVVLTGQAGVSGRFRIERPSRDDLGQDWFVALPLELRRAAWSGRLRLSHRSSHLGDEFMEETGARRIEFGGEAVDLHAARDLGGARIYAGGSWIFRSYTELEAVMQLLGRADRFLVQLGADGAWGGRSDGRTDLVAGVDVQLAERTGWRRQLAALVGVRWSGRLHALQLNARVYDGPSAMGEFFLTPERYIALEFVAEL